MADYKSLINPSTSDVAATTSAEALAMGKWLVVPKHPCNEFFLTFQSCLMYDPGSPDEFSERVLYASQHTPAKMNDEDLVRLPREDGTRRFLQSCSSVNLQRGHRFGFERMSSKLECIGYNVLYIIAYVWYMLISKMLQIKTHYMPKLQEHTGHKKLS